MLDPINGRAFLPNPKGQRYARISVKRGIARRRLANALRSIAAFTASAMAVDKEVN